MASKGLPASLTALLRGRCNLPQRCSITSGIRAARYSFAKEHAERLPLFGTTPASTARSKRELRTRSRPFGFHSATCFALISASPSTRSARAQIFLARIVEE